MKQFFIILLFIIDTSFLFSKPSWCKYAKLEVEKRICKNPELSYLDEKLNDLYYATLKNALNPSYIKREQKSWLKARNINCKYESDNCLKKYYLNRIDELEVFLYGSKKKYTTTAIQIKSTPTSVSKVVKKQPALPKPKVTTGTGFFITSNQVITNNHVIKNCKYIIVKRNGYKTSATIRATDKINDLGILDVSKSNSSFLKYRGNNRIEQGDEILAMGYPLGNLLGNNLKLTNGMINALNGLNNDATKYQISAPVQPGNSGGPIVDMSGLVVGVVYAGLNNAQNVNFAIKASVVKMFLEANGVEYQESNSNDIKKANEIFRESKNAIVQVICK